MTSVREIILSVVNSKQGVKAVTLVLDVLSNTGFTISNTEYELELNKLVQEGEIIELEYILPEMNYRIKSIYFPKETKFQLKVIGGLKINKE